MMRNHKFTMSELRGILLVLIGLGALGYYYSWWFTTERPFSIWLLLGLIASFIYSIVQLGGNWILYLATHYRQTNPKKETTSDLTIDVFVTAYDEAPNLIEQTLVAACNMRGEHRTWLLDDGNNPALARLAGRIGAGYLTRSDHEDAKAGNVNTALARTNGDIVVIFDIDHAPRPDFLEQTLDYFADPIVGFVQVMLTFGNKKDSWVAEAAAESSLDFYNPTSIGADGIRSATLIGSNALIRREALHTIGGYKPGLAEDLATSIALHAAGWDSIYIHEPLAPGLAPPDIAAWFTQQLKWARGVFELLITKYPPLFKKLRMGQRISYAVRMTYYWIGTFICIHLLLTIINLFRGSAALQTYETYLLHLMPLVTIILTIRQLALRRWRHRSLQQRIQWQPLTLVLATWPIYTIAWIMAALRVPLSFRPTPKTPAGRINPLWLLPQLIGIVLLLGGMIYAAGQVSVRSYPLVFLTALGLTIVQLPLLWNGMRKQPQRYPQKSRPSARQMRNEATLLKQ